VVVEVVAEQEEGVQEEADQVATAVVVRRAIVTLHLETTQNPMSTRLAASATQTYSVCAGQYQGAWMVLI
jgi:hypothetical protein